MIYILQLSTKILRCYSNGGEMYAIIFPVRSIIWTSNLFTVTLRL